MLLRENTTFERMAVKTTGGHYEGVNVIPTGNTGGDVLIKDSEIDASGCGIYTLIHAGRKLGAMTISDSSIKAPEWGVYTENNGTMGAMTITDAAGKITGGTGAYRAILRWCVGGSSCTGPLEVDGWSTPAGGWWNSPTDMYPSP